MLNNTRATLTNVRLRVRVRAAEGVHIVVYTPSRKYLCSCMRARARDTLMALKCIQLRFCMREHVVRQLKLRYDLCTPVCACVRGLDDTPDWVVPCVLCSPRGCVGV